MPAKAAAAAAGADRVPRQLALSASLGGILEYGGEPRIFRSDRCALWPAPVEVGARQIFVDGYFVFDDRLSLGRSCDESMLAGLAIAESPRAFLRRVQNGFFNIVVNDRERRETRIFNDAFGALPLYLLKERDRLIFASTYAGLWELAGHACEPDPVGLAELYHFGYPLGDRTTYRGVSVLPAGSILTIGWRDGGQTIEAFEAEERSTDLPQTIGEMAQHVAEAMQAANKRLYRPEVSMAAKISAGMDSRLICATWPGEQMATYTFGFPGSAEVRIAGRLADALGMRNTFLPIEGDFFTRLHVPFFGLHGITEFFHQAALPAMKRDGVELALDGLAGDVLFGGLTLKRSQYKVRQALGLKPRFKQAPTSDEDIADDILRQIRVPDRDYRPLSADAALALENAWEAIRADMGHEVRKARARGETYDQIYTEVLFRNRTRRYISLQGTMCRPDVETLYPFLDRDLQRLRGRIPPDWVANKQLYLKLYSQQLPRIRSVPSLFSLLPFAVPVPLHHAGRIVRYGLEQAGLELDYRTGGRFGLWPANGVQWGRWLAFNDSFREGARRFMHQSPAFDAQEFARATADIARGPKMSATRFMLTASYCGHYGNSLLNLS